ncbi:MAG: hypothetical protein ABIF01_01240, partial [Candidatus Micrarchaeota archaeon]
MAKKKVKKALKKQAKKKTAAPIHGLEPINGRIPPKSMGAFSSLYLDPIEGGFKISIWSEKEGLIEGFARERDMAPFVRKVLFKRTESMKPGDCIELIGKRHEDIELIASEPIEHPQVVGTLVADVMAKENGEIHLKITLQKKEEPGAGLVSHEVNIDHLAEIFNLDIKKNMKITDYEVKAAALVKEIREAEKLLDNPDDKKTM